MDVVTDFVLIGARSYVNSSTLLSEARKALARHLVPEARWHHPVVDAQFHGEVLSNGVFRFFAGTQAPTAEATAGAKTVMRFQDRNWAYTAVFLEDTGRPVERRLERRRGVGDLQLAGDYSGRCLIDVGTADDLFANAIEANKQIHLLTVSAKPGPFRVVNLFMRRVPLQPPVSNQEGSCWLPLVIRNIGVRRRDDSIATLSAVSLPDTFVKPFEVAFALFEQP
ncbi:MAG: hypothetical protein AB1634_07115 [Thermodesulfobacteriota bacterium]